MSFKKIISNSAKLVYMRTLGSCVYMSIVLLDTTACCKDGGMAEVRVPTCVVRLSTKQKRPRDGVTTIDLWIINVENKMDSTSHTMLIISYYKYRGWSKDTLRISDSQRQKQDLPADLGVEYDIIVCNYFYLLRSCCFYNYIFDWITQ